MQFEKSHWDIFSQLLFFALSSKTQSTIQKWISAVVAFAIISFLLPTLSLLSKYHQRFLGTLILPYSIIQKFVVIWPQFFKKEAWRNSNILIGLFLAAALVRNLTPHHNMHWEMPVSSLFRAFKFDGFWLKQRLY